VGNLAHPNILPIHDVNLYTEYPNLVEELAPNGSARRLINDAEEIPVELVFKYLLQTLHALRAAHAQRVYHRGLKPEQLLIDGYGNVKVSDFGFTRIVERDHAVIRQIYVGMGNVAYMAPELYSDPTMSGPQGDIYALGIIFYELLTRKLPGRRSPMPSQLNPSLPRGIDDIFDKMTRDSRAERYATVDDILDDIDKLEGMEMLLDRQSQVLVGDSPLSSIKFRPGAEEPITGTPIDGMDDDEKKGSSHRPYSFQQRRNKKPDRRLQQLMPSYLGVVADLDEPRLRPPKQPDNALQRLLPSNCVMFSCVASTSSRQRVLMATIGPRGPRPCANERIPHVLQNTWWMTCLLNL
jgi:serine/threonine protein kinase